MSHIPPETQAIGLAEAARILGYRDRATIRRLIANGQLQAFRTRTVSGRGTWRINRSSIAQLLAGRRQQADDGTPVNSRKAADSLLGINSVLHL